MAAAKKRRHAEQFSEAETGVQPLVEPLVDSAPFAPPRRRRWPRIAVAAALALLAALWLLPWIVASTPLLAWVLDTATADLKGRVAVESASLGWFSPIGAAKITVHDAADKLVLEAEELAGDQPLWALLWDRTAVGSFRLHKPKLAIILRDGNSNVEDLLSNYLTQPSSGRVGIHLEIADGSVSITDQAAQTTWQIENLQFGLTVSANKSEPLELKVSGVMAAPRQPGRLAVELGIRPCAAEAQPAAQGDAQPQGLLEWLLASVEANVSVDADAVPLAMFDALVSRAVANTRLDGRLSAKIQGKWGGEGTAGQSTVHGDLSATSLSVATASLGSDRLEFQRLHAVCDLAGKKGQVEVKPSVLESDLGTVTLAGTLELGGRKALGSMHWLLHQNGQVTGQLDLARLARMLPKTLRVREGAQITSGQVRIALASLGESDGRRWQAQLDASNLKAEYQGRPLVWDRPISLALDAQDTTHGPVVKDLKCESDFLKLHAQGTLDELAAAASFDLKQLGDQLGQFIDLGGVRLAGNGWAKLNWKRSPQQEFGTDGDLQVRDFRLEVPGYQPWVEENLVVCLAAKGRTDGGSDTRVHEASLILASMPDAAGAVAAGDRIDVQLTQPVRDVTHGGTWNLGVTGQGQLGRWPPRLRTWIDLPGNSLAGLCQLTAQLTATKDGVKFSLTRLAVQQLHLAAFGLNVNEPKAELVLDGNWDWAQKRLALATATLSGSSLSAETRNLALAYPAQGPWQLTGEVKYAGDLAKVQPWLAAADKPLTWQLGGRLTGTAELTPSGGQIAARFDAAIADLAVAGNSGEPFREPQVRLTGQGSYEMKSQVARLDRLELTSDALGVAAKGQIDRAKHPQDLQVDGLLRYDLAKISQLLRPYLGKRVQLTGAGSSMAMLHGPLDLARMQGSTSLRWDSARMYGLETGPNELKVSLADGVFRVEPVNLGISQGHVLVAPQVRLGPGTMELTMPAGPVVQQVQITPEMCAAGLKFIAPILAEVSMTQGTFSLDLEACRIPLTDLARGDVTGRLTVHSVEVGPGPLVRELAVLMNREAPARMRPDSVIPFRLVGGRIYHKDLELTFPDLTIRTAGSVGLDETVSIVAEMPIPPKWISDNALGTALRDQTIRLPIAGTLGQPRLDRRELEKANRQLLERTARNVLGNEVSKGLEQLFGPKR